MFCERCGTPLEEDMLFCPECGLRTEAQEPESLASDEPAASEASADRQDTLRTRIYERSVPDGVTKRYDRASDDTENDLDLELLAARLEEMDVPQYEDPLQSLLSEEPFDKNRYADVYPQDEEQPIPPRAASSVSARSPVRNMPRQSSGEPVTRQSVSPPIKNEVRQSAQEPDIRSKTPQPLDDGYTQYSVVPEGKYRGLSAGKRVGSVFLCIFTALVLLFTLFDFSLRMTLTEDNIRDASAYDKMAGKDAVTDLGIMPVSEYLIELIGADSARQAGVTNELLELSLGDGRLPGLVADVLSDYANYLFRDREPSCLNAEYITAALDAVNDGIGELCGYDVRAFDTQAIAERINGGSWSFLSIDSSGGWFQRTYGVSPGLPATVLSLPVLMICAVIVLLALAMVFFINSSNAPSGLRFNGVVLMIDGGLCLLTALGSLIVSLIKKLWILSDLLLKAAFWLGACGAALLLIGIVVTAVAKSLKKRARAKAEEPTQ